MMGGFFFDLVVVFLAAADLVVILVAFGLELRVLDALADLVVVFFTAGFDRLLLSLAIGHSLMKFLPRY